MQYRLRTLLIVLTLAPPILAVPIWLLWRFREVAAPIFVVGTIFAVFWLACGLIWLQIVRIFEYFSGDSRR